ncbi:calcium-binding protein 8 isoform 2-T6 [Morphnus guianensis]
MPFHHVTAGLLYKGNYLNRSLSAGSDSEQLANISVEELDEIREAFRVLDRDGNGFISKQELGMAMRSLGYMPSEVELAIIMQRLDMDGDGQVDFDEFMTILGPKLVSSEGRDGFLGNTIDSIFWQFDMQRITLEELKHILYHAFRDHLTMKDIENIIINEEESLNENSGNCQTEFEGVCLSHPPPHRCHFPGALPPSPKTTAAFSRAAKLFFSAQFFFFPTNTHFCISVLL